MDDQTTVSYGFKPNLKYKRNGKPKERPDFKWKRTPEGRFVLCIIGRVADNILPEAAFQKRNFIDYGASGDFLLQKVNEYAPWFSSLYFEKTRALLTPSIVYNRFHKMYYENTEDRSRRGQMSGEHYKKNRYLLTIWHSVDEVIRLHKKLSRKEAIEICSNIGKIQ